MRFNERFIKITAVLGLGVGLSTVLWSTTLNNPASAQEEDYETSAPRFTAGVEHQSMFNDGDQSSRDIWKSSFGNHVVIDNTARVIGGDVPYYAGGHPLTGQHKVTPVIKLPFTVNHGENAGMAGAAVLTIGMVQGINTPQAHKKGQSSTHYVSSPSLIKINGHRVVWLYENGHDIRVKVPAHLINKDGINILQFESGFYFPEENRIAYDQVLVKNLALDL